MRVEGRFARLVGRPARSARRAAAVTGGLAFALAPAIAAAAEHEHSRVLDPPGDMPVAALATLGGIAVVMVLGTLGYLYRERRGLEWDFQRPDPEGPDHH